MTSNGSRSGEKKEKRSFWGVRVREREKEKEREREVDGASKLTHMIGYLTATALEDWNLMMDLCERASASEANAKAAVRALRSEFKNGPPPVQLSAARSTSRKFLDTLEELLSLSSTSPVVRERVLEVVAAAAYASGIVQGAPYDNVGFRGLWKRVRPLDKPEEGIPFDTEDEIFQLPNTTQGPGYGVPFYQEPTSYSINSSPFTPVRVGQSDFQKKEEEGNRKDLEMEDWEDVPRRYEAELMRREADNFCREEMRKMEEARREKARQEEVVSKREEAAEAKKKAAEEEDNMKQKLEAAEAKRNADETAKRGEEDLRRREEARSERFRQPELQRNVSEFSNPAFKGPRHPQCLSESGQPSSSQRRGYDPLSTNEKSGTAGACNNTTSGNMFTGNSCFMGGSYYNVRGNAHFSSLFQVSFGFEILYRNISASAFHDSRARSPQPRCHSSTRKGILAKITDQITETPSSSKILYLFGSEGTGKSAIAQTIAEYCKTNNILGASFFFSRLSSEGNTDKNLIATLAYQLCVSIPELKLFIAKAVEDDLSTFQKDVDTQMERLIINPIIQASDEGKTLRYPILIVIDGLDECEGTEDQCAFLRAISGAIGRYSLPLYFFITSRRGGHIVKWLNEDRTRRWILDLDQNHIQTKRDIEAYICSEFERIRSVHHIPESVGWPSQASIQMVVSKTNMLFSCASEIMAFIDQKNAPSPSPETQLELFLGTSGPCV